MDGWMDGEVFSRHLLFVSSEEAEEEPQQQEEEEEQEQEIIQEQEQEEQDGKGRIHTELKIRTAAQSPRHSQHPV